MYIQQQYILDGRWFTMPKTAVISARIDPALKRGAEQVFDELGLNATQAITLFYRQVELERGLPFAVRVPNGVTVKALEQARKRQELVSCNTLDDLFKDLGI
jgi:DNA-damage-inducible protein J